MSPAQSAEGFRGSALLRPGYRETALKAVRGYDLLRREDSLQGKIGRTRRSGMLGAQAAIKASGKLQGISRSRAKAPDSGFVSDPRQRVIVKLHYHKHAGGAGGGGRRTGSGGGKLIAHGRYLERDGAGPEGEPGHLYDRDGEALDAAERLFEWERDDPRHMRLLLAPESGARFVDMQDFTRATMAQMERDLGFELDWVAADHHNTDSPHVHVILRGRRRDGPELIIPRDYAAHGLRYSARDVATQMLGDRGREDERLALEREMRSLRLTRLDQTLARNVDLERPVRVQSIGKDLDPSLAAAMRGRAQELVRMGLGREVKRDVIQLEPDWRDRLERIGTQLDIKKTLGRSREPGLEPTRLYAPSMGSISGEVLERGARGEDGTKAYLIIQPERGGPVFVNTNARAVEDLEPGGMVAIRAPSERHGRVSVQTLSAKSLEHQIDLHAETPIDRDLDRLAMGEPPRLPNIPSVQKARAERAAWLEREGLGQTDPSGHFSFEPGAREHLNSLELQHAQTELMRETGKGLIDPHDGLEREWRVRGIRTLQQGRFAELERANGVALTPIAKDMHIEIGKVYSLAPGRKGMKLSLALDLER